MSLRRLITVARKEFHHVTRDPRTLFLVTIAPAILLVMLAYVFSFDSERVNLIVLDQDKSALSRQYIADLTSDGTFRVLAYVDRQDEIDEWLKAGRAHLALVIPPGTDAALQARQSASIQAILDGVDIIAAGQTLGQLNARTSLYSVSLLPTLNGEPIGPGAHSATCHQGQGDRQGEPPAHNRDRRQPPVHHSTSTSISAYVVMVTV